MLSLRSWKPSFILHGLQLFLGIFDIYIIPILVDIACNFPGNCSGAWVSILATLFNWPLFAHTILPGRVARSPGGKMGSNRANNSSKERLKWTKELHDLFEKAVNQIGGPDSKWRLIMSSHKLQIFVFFLTIRLVCFPRSNSERYSQGYGNSWIDNLSCQESFTGLSLSRSLPTPKKQHDNMQRLSELFERFSWFVFSHLCILLPRQKYRMSVFTREEDHTSKYTNHSVTIFLSPIICP